MPNIIFLVARMFFPVSRKHCNNFNSYAALISCHKYAATHSMFPSSFNKNLLVYYWECCELTGYATRYLSSIDIELRLITRQGRVFRQKTMLIPRFFLNEFEEMTNTSLFLLKQLDYSLSISRAKPVNYLSPIYHQILSL